mmetsp:Transcript_112579/g.323565  ORF Transcript_112579/g.323565 Transcript_112579/m.323565 type:complete len:268 (-) Transcript_112579:1443-2246(-)
MDEELVDMVWVVPGGGDRHTTGPVLAELRCERRPRGGRVRWGRRHGRRDRRRLCRRSCRRGCRRRCRRLCRVDVLRVHDPEIEGLVFVALGDMHVLAEVAVRAARILRVMPHDRLAIDGLDAPGFALLELQVVGEDVVAGDSVVRTLSRIAIGGGVRQPPVLLWLPDAGLEPDVRGGIRVALLQLDVLAEPAVGLVAGLNIGHDDGLAFSLVQAHLLAMCQQLVDRDRVEAILADPVAAMPGEAVRSRDRRPGIRHTGQRCGGLCRR